MELKVGQDFAEIARLADIARAEGCKSYLEIGSKSGGSLWTIGAAMPAGSRIVSVDLPDGNPVTRASLDLVAEQLCRRGQTVDLIEGDSTGPEVIEKVRAFAPFDLVFIDGDHRLAGVTADFANYGPMGKIVAFHDIAWRRAPEWQGIRIDVPQFWHGIKDGYRHEEIVLCRTGKNNGIGVLWR